MSDYLPTSNIASLLAEDELLWPSWTITHANVIAFTTTRIGGVSTGPFASNNLRYDIGDAAEHVTANRQRLTLTIAALERGALAEANTDALAQPCIVQWLDQVHGIDVAKVPLPESGMDSELAPTAETTPRADAMWTKQPGVALAIQTADCLPVLLCDRAGTVIGAAHAGWRGLVAGVLEALVAAMPVAADDLVAWIGPGIGPQSYEVGAEVWQPIAVHTPQVVLSHPTDSSKRLLDLKRLAELKLRRIGLPVEAIFSSAHCTYTDARLFSYRQATQAGGPGQTGRMASVIALPRSF